MKKEIRSAAVEMVNNLLNKNFDQVFQDADVFQAIENIKELEEEAEKVGDHKLLKEIKQALTIFESDELEKYWVENYTTFTSLEEYRQSLDVFAEDEDYDPSPYDDPEEDFCGMPEKCYRCNGQYCELYSEFVGILNSGRLDRDCPKQYLLSLAEKNAEAAAVDDNHFDHYYGLR